MLDKKHLQSLKKSLHSYALVRRDVIKISGDALHHAKRAIFSMHRGDMKEAQKKIKESETLFKALHKKYSKDTRIKDEGAYKAGLEEYVEAVLLYQFVTKGNIGKITELHVDSEIYLAGLCDVPGELYRYAIRAATNRDIKTVEQCRDMANDVIGELIEFDLTKYLRTKFDQAKQAVNKLEYVVYEVCLRDTEKGK